VLEVAASKGAHFDESHTSTSKLLTPSGTRGYYCRHFHYVCDDHDMRQESHHFMFQIKKAMNTHIRGYMIPSSWSDQWSIPVNRLPSHKSRHSMFSLSSDELFRTKSPFIYYDTIFQLSSWNQWNAEAFGHGSRN
jgi:hypothetical protein